MSFVSSLDLPIPNIEAPDPLSHLSEKDLKRVELLKSNTRAFIQGELFEKYKNYLKIGSGQELLEKIESEFLNDIWYYRYVRGLFIFLWFIIATNM